MGSEHWASILGLGDTVWFLIHGLHAQEIWLSSSAAPCLVMLLVPNTMQTMLIIMFIWLLSILSLLTIELNLRILTMYNQSNHLFQTLLSGRRQRKDTKV